MNILNSTLHAAVIKILLPLVKILLRNNISHSEFSELARQAYVDVAMKHFKLPKRKPSYSRVSVLTGLSRKEVVRICNREQTAAEQPPQNRGKRVVNGWLKDKDFLDGNGKPRDLKLDDERNGFGELVKRYSGGTPARAILDELLHIGVVSKPEKSIVCLNHYGYLPQTSEIDMINVFSNHVSDLLDTCEFNLNQSNSLLKRFQRQVTYVDVPVSLAQEFQSHSHERLLSLIVELNQWLAAHNEVTTDSSEPTCRTGVGAYYFYNSEQKDSP